MRDLERARQSCSMALDMADELRDDSLIRSSLGYFATLYAVAENERIPEQLLRRIEQSVCCDTTATARCTQAQTRLLRNRPEEARRILREVECRTSDTDLLILAQYLAYRADMLAGDYREAAQKIHRFIFLTDSATRSALQASAGMIEKEFFRERAAFTEYRMRNRKIREAVVAAAALLLLAGAALVVRQRIRLHKERNERYLLLVREARSEYCRLSRHLEEKHLAENELKGLIASRFDIVDRLGRTLYERENTAAGQAAMTREVKQLIEGFSENGEMLQELERIVDMAHDNAMHKLRRNFPRMKEADIRLLCYIFGGFSPQVISLFMDDSVANVYARKSRLKTRIKASDAPDREFFVTLLG